MHTALKLLRVTVCAAAVAPAFAVDDGPRAYFPVPVGTNNLNLIGLFQSTNSSLDPATAIKGADLSVEVGILQYSRTFDIGGNSAGIVVVAPFGAVRGEAVLEGPLGNNTLVKEHQEQRARRHQRRRSHRPRRLAGAGAPAAAVCRACAGAFDGRDGLGDGPDRRT